MLTTLVVIAVMLWSPNAAQSWGELGHRAIGEAVQASLDNDTLDAIANIVEHGKPLAEGTLAESPAAAAHKHVGCDRGGNQLQFESPQATLHSIWDNCLVQLEVTLSCAEHSGLPGVTTLAAKMTAWMEVPTPSVSRPKGDHHESARRWATDSLHVADESEMYHLTLTNPRTTGALVKKPPGRAMQ